MDVCPSCNREFTKIGTHWNQGNEDHRPSFTEKQWEIIVGSLMGDGSVTVSEGSRNPVFQIEMINEEYVKYLSDQFNVLGGSVFRKHSAAENAERMRKSGFRKDAKEEDYSDSWYFQTSAHPELHPLREWYSSGNKIFPEHIGLTPTVLRHWYCQDGSLKSGNVLRIYTVNEINNKDKIESYFSSVGLPEPSWWGKDYANWNKDESEKLFEYMGKSSPGFSKKWSKEFL